MTQVSPLFYNRLNNSQSVRGTAASAPMASDESKHQKTYEELIKRAHEVKPNEAKAKVLYEGPIKTTLRETRDTFVDAGNVVKAVKKGEMSDNSLGRMNDLGLKAGALLIATFLATHAKTKTEALMQFIGGGTFIASMSLLPEIFINLPARLIHGFPINQKYISAQGDKKDVFLDNQFIVWDAQDEDKMRKYAKNAGIYYDGENGKEKIERKMQKTALQNRTLTMLLIGLGVPTATSLVGNVVEPRVRNAVVNHEFKKTQQTLKQGLDSYLNNSKEAPKNVKELDNLIASYKGKQLDSSFYSEVSKMFDISDIFNDFKDKDDFNPIKHFTPYKVVETLKKLQKENSEIDIEALKETLKGIDVASADAFTLGGSVSKMGESQISSIISALGEDRTPKNLLAVLRQNTEIAQEQLDTVMSSLKTNNDKFFEIIKNYNKETMPELKGKLKAYLKLVNSTVGSTAESVTTKTFHDSMLNTFKVLGFDKDYKMLRDIQQKEKFVVQDAIAKVFQSKVYDISMESDEYKNLISRLGAYQMPDKVKFAIKELVNEKNVGKLQTNKGIAELDEAIFGSAKTKGGIIQQIINFINLKQMDLETVQSKPIMCANFEARNLKGDFKQFDETWVEIARNLVYNGNASNRFNKLYCENPNEAKQMLDVVFDIDKFDVEESVVPGIKKIVKDLKEFSGNQLEQYTKTGSFTKLAKEYARKLYNDKTWLKIFAPLGLALAVIPLVIQPFFGNIEKEFSEEAKGGAR